MTPSSKLGATLVVHDCQDKDPEVDLEARNDSTKGISRTNRVDFDDVLDQVVPIWNTLEKPRLTD